MENDGRTHRNNIKIGSSGYSFCGWVGPFYPAGTKSSGMLTYYSRCFDIVEINATYYRIPGAETFANFVEKTDSDFQFVVKLHGSMTHERNADESVFRQFFSAVSPVERSGRLHSLLGQFPYSFRNCGENLDYLAWLKTMVGKRRLFVEFRHVSWVEPAVFSFLKDAGIYYCIPDAPKLEGLVPPVIETPGGIGYIRLHGRNSEDWWRPRPGSDRYNYDYSDSELEEWAEVIRRLSGSCNSVLVFFNNCHFGHAPRNALKMKQLLELPEIRNSLPGEMLFE